MAYRTLYLMLLALWVITVATAPIDCGLHKRELNKDMGSGDSNAIPKDIPQVDPKSAGAQDSDEAPRTDPNEVTPAGTDSNKPVAAGTDANKKAASGTDANKKAAPGIDSNKPAASRTDPNKPAQFSTDASKKAALDTDSNKPAGSGTDADKKAASDTDADKAATSGTDLNKSAAPGTNANKKAASGSNPSKPAPAGTDADKAAAPGTDGKDSAPPGTDSKKPATPETNSKSAPGTGSKKAQPVPASNKEAINEAMADSSKVAGTDGKAAGTDEKAAGSGSASGTSNRLAAGAAGEVKVNIKAAQSVADCGPGSPNGLCKEQEYECPGLGKLRDGVYAAGGDNFDLGVANLENGGSGATQNCGKDKLQTPTNSNAGKEGTKAMNCGKFNNNIAAIQKYCGAIVGGKDDASACQQLNDSQEDSISCQHAQIDGAGGLETWAQIQRCGGLCAENGNTCGPGLSCEVESSNYYKAMQVQGKTLNDNAGSNKVAATIQPPI